MKTASNHFLETPHSKLGWWSVRLGVGFVVLFLINSFVFIPSSSDAPWRHVILPFYGIFMLLCGLGAGVVGLIAVLRQHERSWLIWLMIVPGLFVLFLLVGELLFPH
ncbi:MAG TPA: hypothetical protein VFR47_29460 [Anaerolineales bacterium]|nr:hypothetical protein [Anaerolineales bacterium]